MNRQRKESLADYVKRIRNGARLALSDVERQRARGDYKIASSYVSRIENGIARNPSKDKLLGLAKGLGVAEDEVFAVARGKPLEEPIARRAEAASLLSRIAPRASGGFHAHRRGATSQALSQSVESQAEQIKEQEIGLRSKCLRLIIDPGAFIHNGRYWIWF